MSDAIATLLFLAAMAVMLWLWNGIDPCLFSPEYCTQ